MKYTVCFTQTYTYEVEAESREEAIDLASEDFEEELSSPFARTDYDDIEIYEEDEND